MIKKQRTRLLFFSLLIIVAWGAYQLAEGLDQERPDSVEGQLPQETIILRMDVTPVEKIYCQRRDRPPFSFYKEGDRWIYAEDPAFPLDQEYVRRILECLKELPGKGYIPDGAERLEQYGLAEPLAELSVSAGQKTLRLKIGNRNETTMNYYLQVNDDPTVYLIEPFLKVRLTYDLLEMAELENIPSIPPEGDCRIVLNIMEEPVTLDRKNGEDNWTLNGLLLEDTKIQSLWQAFSELSFIQCAGYKLGEAERDIWLSDCSGGLRVETPDKLYALFWGEGPDSEHYYAWPQDSNRIYLMDIQSLEALSAAVRAAAFLPNLEENTETDNALSLRWE